MNFRVEKESDFAEVENLVREAFWNKYRPGCAEHYVLHKFRSNPDFICDLDIVVEQDGKIVGQIMYSKSKIKLEDGSNFEIAEFGPVSVLPEFQGKGIGTKIITYSLKKAKQMGIKAIAITGDPKYYHKFGFRSGSSFNISYKDCPNEEAPFFMLKELVPNALEKLKGTYKDPDGYFVKDAEVDKFDKRFTKKEKQILPGQLS